MRAGDVRPCGPIAFSPGREPGGMAGVEVEPRRGGGRCARRRRANGWKLERARSAEHEAAPTAFAPWHPVPTTGQEFGFCT